MSSSESVVVEISDEERHLLLDVAEASIDQTLRGEPSGDARRNDGRRAEFRFPLSSEDVPPALRDRLATFVTLRIGGDLRGCMGSLEAIEPLVENVARNAIAAAFRDPRFSPLTSAEFDLIDIHLSILSRPEPIEFADESELLSRVRPGIDGLILIEGDRRGTLLPAVWEQLSDPCEFVSTLKRKAGLASDHWSDTLRVLRYTARSLAREQ
ncbi:MAG: AmmeMemoRadiSam system protein A [Planctomycetaceae bacterium]